jgi:hypothetical protein
LVRTGVTSGLSQPVTFDGLTVLDKISEDEVVTTLPEAVRFVMALDRREEALLEKRDEDSGSSVGSSEGAIEEVL